MSRFKNTIKIGLVTVAMMLAVGTPAQAETAMRGERSRISSSIGPRRSVLPTWFKRFSIQLKRFTRYAMAAN